MRKYYVYVHKNPETGDIFYVGKGTGIRWKKPHGRNIHWKRYVNKYGFEPSILIGGISEICALSIEASMISDLIRRGVRLTNLVIETAKMETVSINLDHREMLSKAHGKNGIYCSNGKVYKTLTHACEHLRNSGYPKASPQNISAVANGKKKSAYGYAWSYDGVPDQPEFTGREATINSKGPSKMVIRSDGVEFVSCADAAIEAILRGYKKASGSAIGSRANNGGRIYGYSWKFC